MTGILDDRANLAGKTAVLLGGGGGIGSAVSLALAEAGVDLLIADLDASSLAQTIDRARSVGVVADGRVLDATAPAELDAFFDWVGSMTSRLDILVNIVGGTRRQSMLDASPEDDARAIQRNYGYVIQSIRRAVPLMRKGGGGGSIVNFTTIEAHRGAAGFAVYAGAKAATTNFTRSLAVELGPERIRLNCLAPDTTPSQGNIDALPPEIRAAMAGVPPEARSKGLDMYIPLKSAPTAIALANSVLFLASDLSAFVTGQTLHVDGGTWAASGFLDWPFGDGFLPVPMAGTLRRLYGGADETGDGRAP